MREGISTRRRIRRAAQNALVAAGHESFTESPATGESFCRFRASEPYADLEIWVYPGKHFRKNGGLVCLDLYCIHHEFNRAWGVENSSWPDGDDIWKVRVFQYRLSSKADSTEFLLKASDVKPYQIWMTQFLKGHAGPWFRQFETATGVEKYLRSEGSYYDVAAWFSHQGKRTEAQKAFGEFLSALPRQIDAQLDDAQSRGLITNGDKNLLKKASLQHEDEYRSRVAQWIG